ncbi:hypothetical protein G9A89_004792 [Geosiphon pyriformis]|nr:hypothetical protein G9A89_004792 [Geosiphon pyriformis]
MEVARTHYEALKKFLDTHIAREPIGGAGSRTNAREKLTRLTKAQFQELSTDVYDELTRRIKDNADVPFLPVRDEFHPKRNQARQKLATLPKNRFKDLASDVYYELDRRFPDFKESEFASIEPNDSGPPPSKLVEGVTSQAPKSNTIVPEKGTLREEIMDYTIQKPTSRPDNSNISALNPGNNLNNNKTVANNHPQPPHAVPAEHTSPRSPRSRTQSQGSSVSDFGRRYIQSISSEGSNKDRSRDTVSSQKSNKNEGLNIASLDSLMADIGNMFDHNKIPSADGYAANMSSQTTSSFSSTDINRKEPPDNFNIADGLGQDKLNPDFDKVKSEKEFRFNSMQKRIQELEAELLAKSNSYNDSGKIQDLERQLEKQKEINQQQSAKLAKLENEFAKLNDDHSQQEEVANEVRKEATTLLEEIKSLSKRNDELSLEKEQDASQIKGLKAEVNEWKTKFERKRIELRNFKATSSFVKEPQKTEIIKGNLLVPTPDGAIEESIIISFQTAINDLLRAGRSDIPNDVIKAMKSIVIACKRITEDVEKYEQRKISSLKDEDVEKLYSLKSNLSTTLSNLMTAAKNHARGYGISPVSLLDAAASHLTATLVDLVKLIKLRPTEENEDPDNEEFQKLINHSEDKQNDLSPRSRSPTLPSPTSGSLRSQNSKGNLNSSQVDPSTENGAEVVDIDEVKKFLEVQTETIVSAIQSLLSFIRNDSSSREINDSVNNITTIVSNVIAVCRNAFTSSSGAPYRAKGEIVLKDLENSVDLLDEMRETITANYEEFGTNKIFKQRLASASFQIAKFTKELVASIE